MKRAHRFSIQLIILMLLSTLTPFAANAEENKSVLQMDELSVQVMPEYAHHPKDKDKTKPNVLYGYHGSLINKSDKPQKGRIEIPLPMNETNFRIGFVADYSADLSEMHEIEYEVNKKAQTISWTTSTEIQPEEMYKFVVEFYVDELKVKDDQKSFDFTFKSFADIGLLNIIVLEPLNTESIKMEPAAQNVQENPYGMKMYITQFQGVKPTEKKTFKVDYKRSDDRTTASIIEEMMGKTENVAATKKTEKLPIAMIAGVLGGSTALLAFVLFLILKKRSNKKKAQVAPSVEKSVSDNDAKKARLRRMLVEGTISQDEYNELTKRLEG